MVGLGDDFHRAMKDAGAPALGLRSWLVVRVGSGSLPAGVYEYDATAPAELSPVRAGVTRDDMERCLVQGSLADAPAMIFVTCDLRDALEERGARAYREVLIQAGAVVARCWLAATAYGLGACATAGIMEDGLRSLAGVDGYRACPLFTLTLGIQEGT